MWPAESREIPWVKTGNFDAFFREKCLTKNKPVLTTDFAAQMIIKVAGNEISINNDTPTELIARVLEVIRHAQ